MSSDRIFERRPWPPVAATAPRPVVLDPSFLAVAESVNSASFITPSPQENTEPSKWMGFFLEKKVLSITMVTWVALLVFLTVIASVFGIAMLQQDRE